MILLRKRNKQLVQDGITKQKFKIKVKICTKRNSYYKSETSTERIKEVFGIDNVILLTKFVFCNIYQSDRVVHIVIFFQKR